jgi:hypothetical protein
LTASFAVAVAACVAALVALVLAFVLWRRVARIQAGQAVVLSSGRSDLLDFAVSLQARIDDLHRAVDEVATGLSRVDRRVDGSVTNTAVVRYDAYEGTGGQQSASVALLDATRTGTVMTAIQGRDYARIYVKDLDRGRSSVALSPEEQEAVERAMARESWGETMFPPALLRGEARQVRAPDLRNLLRRQADEEHRCRRSGRRA